MNALLFSPTLGVTLDQLVQIGFVIFTLFVIWIVVRAVLRLAVRIFAIGCGAILVLGLVLAVAGYFTR